MANEIVTANEEQTAGYVVPHRYEVDELNGLPVPKSIRDTKAMDFALGPVHGTALALDLFNWFTAYRQAQEAKGVPSNVEFRDVAANGFIRCVMDDAYAEIQASDSSLVQTKAGQAIGFLDSVAYLVVCALEDSPNAKRYLQEQMEFVKSSTLDSVKTDLEEAGALTAV